jgi:hypothetical protein
MVSIHNVEIEQKIYKVFHHLIVGELVFEYTSFLYMIAPILKCSLLHPHLKLIQRIS